MKNNIMRFGLLAVLIAGIALMVLYRDQFDAAALESWVRDAGFAGPIIFMLIYTVATVLFLPGSVLTLAGGALFGPVLGTFYNLTGATLGAVISFLAARYLAADWVETKVGGRMKQLKQGVEGEGWQFVAFVRLVPLFPFNLLNYALGLTKISTWHYTIASYVFMLPGALAYTYLGYALREAVGGEGDLQQTIQIGILATALIAIVFYLPRIIGRMRRGPMLSVQALQQLLNENKALVVLDVRTAEDFIDEQGHIANAINIPVENLAERLDEIMDHTEKTIAIVCRTDKRSAKAAQVLARNGFSDTHVVQGGMTKWNEAGYAIER